MDLFSCFDKLVHLFYWGCIFVWFTKVSNEIFDKNFFQLLYILNFHSFMQETSDV